MSDTESGEAGMICSSCGGNRFEGGFVDDAGAGRIRWFQGPMRLSLIGNSRRTGTKRTIKGWRCVQCNRLELYAVAHD